MAQLVRKSPAPDPKRRYRVTNWCEYNCALVARGAITLWIDEAVVAGWGACGGKGWRYSDMAILCALSLRAVFGLTRDCQEFRVWAGIVGSKEIAHGSPQGPQHTRRAA